MKVAYPSSERLLLQTGVNLGDNVNQTFRKIGATLGGLHKYLTGVSIVISGSAKQSETDAVCTKETIWGLVDKCSLRGLGHTWFSGLHGESIIAMNIADEHIRPSNLDEHTSADFADDTATHTFTQAWHIPVCPGLFSTKGSKGKKDGIFPLALMKDHGVIDFDIVSSLGGNWALTTSTTLTVKIILHTLVTEDVIAASPWRIDSVATADSEFEFASREGTPDMIFTTDDSFGALTQPTDTVKLEIDGLTMRDGLNGAELVYLNNRYRDDATDDLWDNGMTPLLMPQHVDGGSSLPLCREVKITDAAHADQGTIRYFIRRYLPMDAEQSASFAKLMKVAINVGTEADRLTIGRRPAASLNLPRARRGKMNLTVRG